MKVFYAVLSAAMLTASAACAADKAAVPAAAVAVEKVATGVVQSVSMADAAKGTKSEIILAGPAGKTSDFLVTATTTLYDPAAKAIALNQVAAKNKVTIAYTVTPEGVKQATSVKVM